MDACDHQADGQDHGAARTNWRRKQRSDEALPPVSLLRPSAPNKETIRQTSRASNVPDGVERLQCAPRRLKCLSRLASTQPRQLRLSTEGMPGDRSTGAGEHAAIGSDPSTSRTSGRQQSRYCAKDGSRTGSFLTVDRSAAATLRPTKARSSNAPPADDQSVSSGVPLKSERSLLCCPGLRTRIGIASADPFRSQRSISPSSCVAFLIEDIG